MINGRSDVSSVTIPLGHHRRPVVVTGSPRVSVDLEGAVIRCKRGALFERVVAVVFLEVSEVAYVVDVNVAVVDAVVEGVRG